MKKILYIIIFILILFSVYMRFRGIFWGLPTETLCLRSFASDEGYTISALKNMKPDKLDFDVDDPEFKLLTFGLGGGALYGGAAVMKVFDILGIAKIYNNRSYYEQHLDAATYLYIPVRLFICIIGVLTIFFVYLTGKELYNNFIGLIAALIFSFNFVHIKHSFILDNHIMMILFVSIVFYLCSKILKTNKSKYYYLAGFFTGVATSNTLNGGFVYILLIIVHAVSAYNKEESLKFWIKKISFDKRIYISFLFLIIGYIVQYPYIFIHLDKLTNLLMGLGEELYTDISSFRFYLYDAPKAVLGLPFYIMTLLSIIYVAFRHNKADTVILIFVFLKLIFLSLQKWQFIRYALMLYIPLSIVTASIFYDLKRFRTIIICLFIISFGCYICYTTANFKSVIGPDPRILASKWIEKNIPKGTKIGCVPIGWTTPPILQKINQKEYRVVEVNFNIKRIKEEKLKYFVTSNHYSKKFMTSIKKMKYMVPFEEDISKYFKNVKYFSKKYSFLGLKAGDPDRYVLFRTFNPTIKIYYN